MTSKSPVRSAEDVDESALSYAEIKALATGNPLIKEKMDLDVQVSKLNMLKASYLSEKYSLEDKILKIFPNRIKGLKERIKGYEKDIAHLEKNSIKLENENKQFNPMQINGKVYLEKEEAGKALLEEFGKLKSTEAKTIGCYRGFKMDLSFDSFSKEFKLTLKNSLNHNLVLGSDIFGNITRIDNVLENMDKKLKEAKEQLINIEHQLENAKKELNKPFQHEKELKEKQSRLSELDTILNMEGREEIEKDTENPELDIAKELIMEFIAKEYDEELRPFDFPDIKHIEIAFTTTEDGNHEIQTEIDLEEYCINQYLDGGLVNTEKFQSLSDFIEFELRFLDFSDLVYIEEDILEKFIDPLDLDKDNDGVMDRYDVDDKDSTVSTYEQLDNRENKRKSILEDLKEKKELLTNKTKTFNERDLAKIEL